MKSALLFLFVHFVLFTLPCFGSGKLSVQGQYFFKSEKVTPTVGISIYEHLLLGVAYNGWTGIGWQPRLAEPSVMWFTSRHDVEKWFGDLGVAAGVTIRHAEQQDAALLNDQDVHVKLTWKLW